MFGIWPRRNVDISFSVLLSLMNKFGVDKACTLSTKGIFYDFSAGNDETLAVCKKNLNLIPVATINPASYLNCYKEVERCIEIGFKIFRFFPEIQEWSIRGLVFKKMLYELSKADIIILIPASEGFNNIVNILGDIEIPVIITSFRYSELGEAIEAIREYSNIYIETHMINSPDFLEILKDEVGLERVVFGSNAPLSYMLSALKPIEKSNINKIQKNRVLGKNLNSLLKGAS